MWEPFFLFKALTKLFDVHLGLNFTVATFAILICQAAPTLSLMLLTNAWLTPRREAPGSTFWTKSGCVFAVLASGAAIAAANMVAYVLLVIPFYFYVAYKVRRMVQLEPNTKSPPPEISFVDGFSDRYDPNERNEKP